MHECMQRDMDSIPGLVRFPEGGHDNPLQYSCLENPWTEELVGYSKKKVKLLSRVQLFATPWTVAY